MKKLFLTSFLFLSACATQSDIVWHTPLEDGKLLYGQVAPETKNFIQSTKKN